MPEIRQVNRLVIVLGDQLNLDAAVFDQFDRGTDMVWMAEATAESTVVWSHKARIALFLAGMRHFRERLRTQKYRVDYQKLDDPQAKPTLGEALRSAIRRLRPNRLAMVRAGEYRVQHEIERVAEQVGLALQVFPDRHFLNTLEEFEKHAGNRKQLRLEYFYRELRRKHSILLDEDGSPVGGKWNYDDANRGSFGKDGTGNLPQPPTFRKNELTKEVLKLAGRRFVQHPGSLEDFNWPLTRSQAERALDVFIEYRLPLFGKYQDALWTEQPFLYHSLLSSSLNLKLLDPQVVIRRAEEAYTNGHAPLESVEGFVRQVLGWREYVRGIYWHFMPEYLERNYLGAHLPLPDFYWTAETEMNCLRQAIGQTLQFGYAHHIQRLMVTGLFALLLGVDPKLVHEWYLAVYVDAVEWVELPNTLGMSQFADGGVMASKPYCASGRYIQRMSNYCSGCRFDPAKATGPDACPFTTLYWDFLKRNRQKLAGNNRMNMQLKNLDRKSSDELRAVQKQATEIREQLT